MKPKQIETQRIESGEDPFNAGLVTENLRRVLYTALILVIALPILFTVYLLFPVREEVKLIFQGVFIGFEIFALAYYILVMTLSKRRQREVREKNDKRADPHEYFLMKLTIYSFWGVVETLGLTIGFILFYVHEDLTMYYMTLVAITIVPVLAEKEMWLYICAELVATLIMAFTLTVEPYYIVGMAMFNGMFILLSRVLYNGQREDFDNKRRVRNMAKASEKDPLTELLNRRGLDRRVASTWSNARRYKHIVAIIMMDIDNFKKYNDTFGHPQGDACLKQVSGAVKAAACRDSDVVARVGGEEFIVYIPEAGSETEALKLAEKIRSNVEDLKLQHSPLVANPYVTVSVGVAYFIPNETNSFSMLYDEADKSLYLAKKNGRNCIVCGNRIFNTSDR